MSESILVLLEVEPNLFLVYLNLDFEGEVAS